MNIGLDYLGVTVRVPEGYDIAALELMGEVVDLMHLREFWKRAFLVGRDKHYATIFRVDDISFKLCKDTEGSTHRQGVMVELTSNGLSHYCEHLAKLDLSIFDIMRDLRALSAAGFIVNYPRLDICMDDICRAGDRPLLKLKCIYDKWCNHEFCSRARPADDESNREFKMDDECFLCNGKVRDHNKKGMIGRTIYFGARKSKVCVRFYDKKIEQLQQGKKVPDDITHWVRCEYEFHAERACSIVSMLIEHSWDEFIKMFCARVLGHLRFINLDDSNRSRCSTCSWWVKFLDNVCTAEKFTIPIKRPAQAEKTVRWLRKSVCPTTYSYIATIGLEAYIQEVMEYGKNNLHFKQLQFMSDYVNSDGGLEFDEEIFPAMFWASLSEKDFTEAVKQLDEDYKALNLCKKYRSMLGDNTEAVVKAALRIS